MRLKTVVMVSLLLISGCASQQEQVNQQETSNWQQAEQWPDTSLFNVYQQWQGVPYQLGGNGRNGIDCSAFVQIAFRDVWQHHLPRTTWLQSQQGKAVAYRDAQYGDLVFFKTSSSTRHVGVYLGDKSFVHASTSQGVTISRLDNPYWAARFWQIRRIEKPL